MGAFWHRKSRGVAVAAVAVAALAAGCGGQGEADLANGKRLFTGEGRCASCHVLERVGSGGVLGPNLDAAFAQARRDGLGEDTIAAIVREQIRNVREGSLMPENLVTGKDAHDVAAYVAHAAGVPGEDQEELAQAGQPAAAPVQEGRRLFNEAGCGGCHVLADAGTTANDGPRLDNLDIAARLRRPGMSPEHYVREAIVDPDAFVVGGYPAGLMPSNYDERLSRVEVDALVQYLLRPGG